MQKNILQSKRVGSDYLRNTIFYGVVGILFAVFGLSQLRWLGLQAVVYLMIGLALLHNHDRPAQHGVHGDRVGNQCR